jgi:hypothetical protein
VKRPRQSRTPSFRRALLQKPLVEKKARTMPMVEKDYRREAHSYRFEFTTPYLGETQGHAVPGVSNTEPTLLDPRPRVSNRLPHGNLVS